MKLRIFISFMLLGIVAFAGTNPPVAVAHAFQTKFPTATDVKWGMENKTEYEADFKVEGKSMSANFKDDGTWLVSESGVSPKELPVAIGEYLNKSMPGAEIKETAKLDLPGGVVNYEIEIKGADYIFDADGKFIKKSEDD
ncbi:MAG: PepSY-like domain-containing protein [Bacteroidota bacterium]